MLRVCVNDGERVELGVPIAFPVLDWLKVEVIVGETVTPAEEDADNEYDGGGAFDVVDVAELVYVAVIVGIATV